MRLLRTILQDNKGAMAVETAIVLPALLLMGLGGAQASFLISKQSELQSAAAEAQQIVVASEPKNAADLASIQSILVTSTGLPTDKVAVEFRYRCGTTTTVTSTEGTCGTGVQWTYVRVAMSYTYKPPWKAYGFGSDINIFVDRTTQVS